MKHRLLNVLAVVSLALCVMTAGLWLRSYWKGYLIEITLLPQFNGDVVWSAASSRGISYIRHWTTYSAGLPPEPNVTHTNWLCGAFAPTDFPAPNSYLYFYRTHSQTGRVNAGRTDRYDIVEFFFPLRNLCLILVILPIFRFWSLLRLRSRVIVGICSMCGYDLRASPDRCPECGTEQRKEQPT